MRAEEETLSWEILHPMLNRLDKACQEIDLQEIRTVLMEAVDGFEPKEDASDPLWEVNFSPADSQQSVQQKVTPLFKE